MDSSSLPLRQIRAKFDDETITVYQAYNEAIANAAIQATTFVSPFKMDRMTWIKPSFLWMAYRSGRATKPGQERILAIKIKRSGFEWALTNASLSNHEAKEEIKKSPVRIQWDPERDISMNKLTVRSIQIGLSGVAVEKYVNEWIVGIEDVTIRMKEIGWLIESGELEQAKRMLPKEEVYPLNEEISKIISADG